MSVRSKQNPRKNNGFTLLEIMVVISIVGLIMGLAIGRVGRSVDREMKKTTARLASTIRYLYNKSAMEGLYIRLVFDVGERTYWVEATSDPVAVTREEDLEKKKKTSKNKDDEEKEKEKEKKAGNAESEPKEKKDDKSEKPKSEEIERIKAPKPKFGQVDQFLLKPIKLPDSILIKDLQVEHRKTPVEAGTESIYFFPNGHVENAVINFRDEKDEINYSIKTYSVSGRVNIEDSYRKLRE